MKCPNCGSEVTQIWYNNDGYWWCMKCNYYETILDANTDWSFHYGWICPKCGRVFSSSILECYYCNMDIKEKKDNVNE